MLTGAIWRLQDAVHALVAPARRPGRPLRGRRQMPALIPTSNPLETAVASSRRNEAALRLVDPDVYGYLLVTVHKQAESPDADIQLAGQIESSWWPAIELTIADILEAAYDR